MTCKSHNGVMGLGLVLANIGPLQTWLYGSRVVHYVHA